ncbi:MAG: class I SAM-dependent methyltransferase [Chloroflexi bacterium]|nr:class I SAM-dependent methyltransferase [Chloroflexota bacterium]
MKPRIIQPELKFCHREWVEQYDRIAATAMAPVFRHFASCIKKTAPEGSRILDIGSGSGRLFLAVQESRLKKLERRRGGPRCPPAGPDPGLPLRGETRVGSQALDYVGIDISPEMARKALENSRGVRMQTMPEFPVAAAGCLPFRDSSFDLVVSSSSLHMWTGPVGIFNEIHRVLRPGGIALIRDSRRLPDNWFWRWFIRTAAVRRGMNELQRRAWTGAIQASYTLEEVRAILRRTGFRHWKAGTDRVFFELCLKVVK